MITLTTYENMITMSKICRHLAVMVFTIRIPLKCRKKAFNFRAFLMVKKISPKDSHSQKLKPTDRNDQHDMVNVKIVKSTYEKLLKFTRGMVKNAEKPITYAIGLCSFRSYSHRQYQKFYSDLSHLSHRLMVV